MFKTIRRPWIQASLGSLLLTIALLSLIQTSIRVSAETSTITSTIPQPSEIGSLVFYDNENRLDGQDIRLLCFDSLNDQTPEDLRFLTTNDGRAPLPLPTGCTYFAAMLLWHTQPSGKPEHGPAYWVYTTSWQPGTTELLAIEPGGDTQEVVISQDNTLVLFNLVASLAWEPPADDPYIENLLIGLGSESTQNPAVDSAASHLYGLTDGTMTFGPMTVHTDGKGWESADIRILPANDLKPSAQVGGMVSESIRYTATALVTSTTVYSPGAIILGRNWVGCANKNDLAMVGYAIACGADEDVEAHHMKLYGSVDSMGPKDMTKYGNWDDGPGYRTIVHEWAHYALFLYDEYQTVTGQRTDCDSAANSQFLTGAASIMDWHYTSDFFWQSSVPLDSGCADTKQVHVHGQADCETLANWYTIQKLENAETLPSIRCGAPSNPITGLGLTSFLVNKTPPLLDPAAISPSEPSPSIYLPLQMGGAISEGEESRQKATVTNASDHIRAATQSGAWDQRQKVTEESSINARMNVIANVANPEIQPPLNAVQGYLVRPEVRGATERIWHQGRVVTQTIEDNSWNGYITLLGAQESSDKFKVFGESFTPDGAALLGGRWFGEEPVSPEGTITLQSQSWAASMDLAYEVNGGGQVISLTAHVTLPSVANVNVTVEPVVQLCSPDNNVRCHWKAALEQLPTEGPNEYWRATIAAQQGSPSLPNYGIVYLNVAYRVGGVVQSERELMTWYKTSGVGPGTFNANAPTPPAEDDMVTVYSLSERKHCNQLIYSAATNYEMLVASLGEYEDADGNIKPIQGILGKPLDIAVRLPATITARGETDCPTTFGLGERPMTQQDLFLTLSYQPAIDFKGEFILTDPPPDSLEEELLILHFSPTSGWEVVEPNNQERSTEMNWISVPFRKDGIYAIGWVQP
ncbi:MAG: hypothetical protein AAF702_25395 [Chloroflexota bacterium]